MENLVSIAKINVVPRIVQETDFLRMTQNTVLLLIDYFLCDVIENLGHESGA